MIADINLLSLETSDFEQLRKNGLIYIDKTDLIYELAKRPLGKIFLSRPRRFGKSLLLSTFKSLFTNGIKYFEGLKIASLWNDRQYKVLHFDFSAIRNFQTIEEFKENFKLYIIDTIESSGLPFDIVQSSSATMLFSRFLKKLDQSISIILLIDEYDAPLNTHLSDKDIISKLAVEFSGFFDQIKTNQHLFRFIFVTGISKIREENLFSPFNILTDISLSPKYSTLLGYTKNEIIHYFNPYINAMAIRGKMTYEQVIDNLSKYYDGFCFTTDIHTHVYAPWSILNFFNSDECKFRNYWYNSAGNPSMILQYINKSNFFDINNYKKDREVSYMELSKAQNIANIDETILLFQTGYLTIKDRKIDQNNDINNKKEIFILNYPNQEILISFAELYLSRFLKKEKSLYKIVDNIISIMSDNNINNIVNFLNSIYISIPYGINSISNEEQCRNIFYLILVISDLYPIAELHNGFGRSDLEVICGNLHWVFEFKFLKKTESSNKKYTSIKNKLLSIDGKITVLKDKIYLIDSKITSNKEKVISLEEKAKEAQEIIAILQKSEGSEDLVLVERAKNKALQYQVKVDSAKNTLQNNIMKKEELEEKIADLRGKRVELEELLQNLGEGTASEKAKGTERKGAQLLLDEAVDQIKKRHYGQKLREEEHLLRVALVYSEEERQIVKSCLVE